MAYEVFSGSVSVTEFFTASFAQQPSGDDGRLDTSYQMIPNPAGTIWAAPVYYHGGGDGSSLNYGINIYHSNSSGIFRADSIDTLNALANNIWWISDTEFWATLGTSGALPYRFISGASGFNDYDSNSFGLSNSAFTEGRLSADRKWFVSFPGSTTTTNRDKIAVFSSASQTTPGRWDRISTIPNAGFEVHFGNSGDSEVTNVHITPNLSNATPNFDGRYIFVAGGDFNSDQGECAVVEISEDSSYIRNTRGSFSGDTMRGHATNSPRIGDGVLYYHSASNRVIVGSSRLSNGQGALKTAGNEIRYFDSSSQGFFNHTVRADNASSNGNFSDGTLITASVRTMGAAFTNQHIDPNGSHDRIFFGSSYFSNGTSNQKNGVIQALESGSSGWKLSVVGAHYPFGGSPSFAITPAGILADGGYFTASHGDLAGTSDDSLDNAFSIAGSTYKGGSRPNHDGIYTFRKLSGIAANPSLASSVTSSIGSGGGTLSAGGTEASPSLSVTIPSNALAGSTSLQAEVVTSADYKATQLSAIKKQAGSSGAEFVGGVYRLTPHGQIFSSAVTVQFVLDSAPSDLQIWKRDHHESGFTQWYQLPSNLWSNSGTTVTISTTRFSEFAGLGGISMARTKLSNSQLTTLTTTDLVDSTSIRVSGSNTGENLTVGSSDLFIFEQGGATYHISASQMAEYFGGLVTVTSSGHASDFRITMAHPSDNSDIGLEVDAGLKYNSADDALKLLADGGKIYMGAGQDVNIEHDGSTGLKVAATGSIELQAATAIQMDSPIVDFEDDGVILQFGAGDDVTLTHVHDTGLLLNSTRQLQFGDSGTYIHQSADGVLDLVSDTEIEINATTVDINGAIDASSTITAAGRIIVDDATDATSTTDGSLQTDGGLSVAKDVVAGNDVKLLSDAAVLNFGADSDVSVTHVADTGLLLNSSRQLQFGDSGTYIHQSADGVLDLVSDTEIEINATTIDINGAIDASSTITAAGRVIIDDATDATSTTDGSLQTDGGLSVAKDAVLGNDVKLLSDAAVLNFGADSDVSVTHVADTGLLLNSSRQLQFGDSGTYIHQSADGVLDLVADSEIEINATTIDMNGAVDISGELTVAGGLNVAGTLTYINTTNLAVEDNLILLSSGSTGNPTKDQGIVFNRGNLQNAGFIFDESDDKFKFVFLPEASGSGVTGALNFSGSHPAVSASAFHGDGSNLTGVGAETIAAADGNSVDLKLTFVSGAAAASKFFFDAGLLFNPNTNLLTTPGNIKLPNDGQLGTVGDPNAIAISDAGVVTLSATAEASAIGTAALVVAGGASVAKDLYVGDDLELDSDSAKIGFGADSDVSLTHVADTGLLLNSSRQLQFGDSGTYIHQSADGVLDLVSDTEIEINATTIDINGAIDASSTITAAGRVIVDDATDATSTTDGSLQTDGGLSVAKDAVLGNDLKLLSDAAVLNFGADSDVSVTHVADTGLLLNSTRQLQFGDSGTYIHQSADGVLDLVSDTEIEINATTIDINGAVDASSTITAAGRVIVDDATDATSTTDGSLQTDGGLSVAKDAVLGNDVKLLSDAAVLNFGADSDVSVTHVADTGLLLNSSRQLQFGDSGTYIHQSADGVLDLVADTEIEINATTVDINGAVDLSSTLTVGTIGDLAAESSTGTHHFLVIDSGDNIVKKDSMSDVATDLADAAGTKGGISVSSGKLHIVYTEDVFISSSDNSSMSGSRNDGVPSGAPLTASLSATPLSGSIMVFLNGLLQTRSGSVNSLNNGQENSAVFDYKFATSGGDSSSTDAAPTKVIMADALDGDDVLVIRYIQKG